METMQRTGEIYSGTKVGTDVSTSDAIDFARCSGGMFWLPAGATTSTLTWYADGDAADGDGFMPVYATLGGVETAVVSKVSAGHAQLIPAACFGAGRLKAVGDVAVVIVVYLKS
jgi:hypothetical protein